MSGKNLPQCINMLTQSPLFDAMVTAETTSAFLDSKSAVI